MEPLFNFVFKKYIIATKLLKPQINESIKYVNKVRLCVVLCCDFVSCVPSVSGLAILDSPFSRTD